tara:strand:- start:61 stop:741 length:681 start_codon:yes stop_codon:yes gene_type:complete
MIDTVIFDFVNTIAFLTPSKEDILVEYCKIENNILLSKKEAQKAYLITDDLMPYSSVNIKTDDKKRAFYEQYNKELFKSLQIFESEKFYDFYHSVKKEWVLDECVPDLLKFLKSKKISIGIISNFDNNLNDVLENLKIKNMFDFVAISAKIGLEKPDIKFYKYAKKVYNINISTAIYVGDSYSLDYVPSRKVGFNSYLIDRDNIILKNANKMQNLNEIKKMVINVT